MEQCSLCHVRKSVTACFSNAVLLIKSGPDCKNVSVFYPLVSSFPYQVFRSFPISFFTKFCKSRKSPQSCLCFKGNVAFESEGEIVQIVGQDTLGHIAELTATDADSVTKGLLYRTVATGGGEVIEKGHTEKDACFGRDAFAKVTFSSPRLTGGIEGLLQTES